jgi:hypothetical protein
VSSTTIGRDKFKFSVFYLYVNNSIFTRDESMINLTINGLNQVFKAKAQKEICDFLECKTKKYMVDSSKPEKDHTVHAQSKC